jgi:hypothetical protein
LPDITITNYSVIRLPVHIRAFNNITNKNNIIKYTITLYNEDNVNATINRTFIISQPDAFIHEFLLQNKYGILEYFFVNTQKIENNIKADEMILNYMNDIDILEKSKTFSVITGVKHYNQLKIIEQASQTENNFIILKNKLCQVYIVPESITTLDESKDLQETSFKFRFKDDNTEEIIIQNKTEISDPSEIWEDDYLDEQGNYIPVTWDDSNKINIQNTENLWNYNTL